MARRRRKNDLVKLDNPPEPHADYQFRRPPLQPQPNRWARLESSHFWWKKRDWFHTGDGDTEQE